MKIPPTTSGIQGTSTGTGSTDATRSKSTGGTTPPSSSAGSGDSVKISSLSTQLQSIQAGLSGPAFDRTKVEKIKQAISDGSLTINSGVIADKILASVHEFLSGAAT